MVSKRSRPYDQPPSPDSSPEDDEQAEPTPVQTHPNYDSEDEDPEEDAEQSDDDDIKKVPESVSGSDSGTESDVSEKVSSYTIKPIVKEKKTVEKTVEPLQQVPIAEVEEEKKALVNRLWSFDDEIVVLQGLIDFKENGKDPGSNLEGFYDFVKEKLSNGKFTKVQVKDKVKRLKKKCKDNLNKSSEFSNSHDLKCFQLSKRIWGGLKTNNNNNNNADTDSNANANAKTISISSGIVVALPAKAWENPINGTRPRGNKSAKKRKIVEKVADHVERDMMKVDNEKMGNVGKSVVNGEEKDFRRLYPHLMKAFEGESVSRAPTLDEMKSCLSKADSVQLKEWDRKWKKIRLAETEAYMSKLALIQEHTTWFSNAMKSSKH